MPETGEHRLTCELMEMILRAWIARDIVLEGAAKESLRTARTTLRHDVPSLDCLANQLTGLVLPELTPAAL